MRRTWVLLLWCSTALARAVGEVAPPVEGHWVRDLTGTLRADTLRELDAVGDGVERAGHGQLGVAVIDTTSGVSPRTFATQLFNHWGVGHAGRNDGILLFAALKDRKAEIILGDGLDDVSTADTDAIMARAVVANFKRKDPDAAMLEGAKELAALLERRAVATGSTAATPTVPSVEGPDVDLVNQVVQGKQSFPQPKRGSWTVDFTARLSAEELRALDRLGDEVYGEGRGRLYVVAFRSGEVDARRVAALAHAVLSRQEGRVFVVAARLEPQDAEVVFPAELSADSDGAREETAIEAELQGGLHAHAGAALRGAAERVRTTALHGPPVRPVGQVVSEKVSRNLPAFGTVGGGVLVGAVAFLRRWARRRPRTCNGCGRPRERLSERSDDPHLSAGQRAEESAGSVDYDVWWCGRCNDALVLRYGAIFSRYGSCRSCGFRTARSSSQTLVHATYDHGGQVRVTNTCGHCGQHHSYVRHTSRLVRTSSSSSGSSFGGGSSSGRGSSGSW